MDSQIALFIFASIALILTPGQDTIYVITRGIAQGKVAGIVSAIGVSSGIIVHTLFAALGLSVILQSSALAFSAIKYAGAVYLIYLGIKTFISREEFSLRSRRREVSRAVLYWQGFICNVFNPKVALFFLAFLPQFVNPSAGNPIFQMTLLGLLFTLMGAIWLSCVGYFAGNMGRSIGQSRTALSLLRWCTSSVLIGLGVRLALPERR
jgi:threonine/homoserine/homoserine lactone efflux protein